MEWLHDLKGAVFFLLLALLLAYGTYQTAGVVLNTDIPVVAVVSNSMSHQLEKDCVVQDRSGSCLQYSNNWNICGNTVNTHQSLNFTQYWHYCKGSFKNVNISKTQFKNFPVSHGFQRGDLLIIRGADRYTEGDVIVYTLPSTMQTDESGCQTFARGLRQRGIGKVVHRIVEKTDSGFRTKGDHNQPIDDCTLQKKHFSGEVAFVVPKVGYLKVLPAEILSRILGFL